MDKVAIVAAIFPGNLPFFNNFLNSIESQTIDDFDLIIIFDGVEDLKVIAGEKWQLIKDVINLSGFPFEIRCKAIKEISCRGYQKIIFSDTDDTLSTNRIEVLSEELNHYSIVCNDLDIINEEGKIVEKGYWKSRLGERFIFDQSFITDKNIVGFGNCGFRLDVNLSHLSIHQNLTAPDWLFFYLMLARNKDALFTAQCSVGYRQHSNNIIGLKTVTKERLLKAISCKIEHYSVLSKLSFDFKKELKKHLDLKETALNDASWVESVLERIRMRNLNLFWWEETNNLI